MIELARLKIQGLVLHQMLVQELVHKQWLTKLKLNVAAMYGVFTKFVSIKLRTGPFCKELRSVLNFDLLCNSPIAIKLKGCNCTV